MLYVALLRGVNVGGANKVDMATLRFAFEAIGLTSVRTYINSGNVIFSAVRPDRVAIGRAIERAIAAHFHREIDVLLRDMDEMVAIAGAIPPDWSNDESQRCDVLFLWLDVDRPSILHELPLRPGVDEARYARGAVITRVARADARRSGLTRLIGSPMYRRMTIRNCNTARRLAAMIDEA